MEIQQLLGFIAVAKSGSFSQAAASTFRTQSAVSQQIHALEKEFQTRLFDRLAQQKVTLTDEGRLFFELVNPIVRDIQFVDEKFKEARNIPDNFQVSVASHNSAMLYLLPQVVKAFNKQYPRTRLSIINRSRNDILALVKNDDVQVCITSLQNPPSWADYQLLGRFRRVLVCRKDHPLKNRSKITLEEIAQYPLILPPIGSDTRKKVDDTFVDKGISYNLALEVSGREAVKSFIQTGIGISIMSEYYIRSEQRNAFIVKDCSQYFGFSATGILIRKGRFLNKATKLFIELVRDEVKNIFNPA